MFNFIKIWFNTPTRRELNCIVADNLSLIKELTELNTTQSDTIERQKRTMDEQTRTIDEQTQLIIKQTELINIMTSALQPTISPPNTLLFQENTPEDNSHV
jgi:hypothetical protein